MLSYVSCIHSLKKSPTETKRVGIKHQVYNYRSLSLCCSLVFVKKNYKKKFKKINKKNCNSSASQAELVTDC